MQLVDPPPGIVCPQRLSADFPRGASKPRFVTVTVLVVQPLDVMELAEIPR